MGIRTAGRPTQILNDLLDLTRSSFGTEIPVVKTRTDIALLCQEIADEHRAINPDRRFEVTHEGDPMGACDPSRLGQVLSNLIGNAIQYGDVSSPITVRAADPETVNLSVHNFGMAIPVETRKMIFQSWMRGPDAKHPPEQGTHLGIIAEADGGDISVTSNEQEGTTFSMRIPRS